MIRLKLISDFSVIIPFLLGMYVRYNRWYEQDLKVFIRFIAIATAVTIMQYMSEWIFGDSVIISHLYTPIEGGFLFYFLIYNIEKRVAFRVSIGIAIICEALDLIYSAMNELEIYASIFEYIVLAMMSMFALRNIVLTTTKYPLKNYKYLIVIFILLYALVSLESALLMISNAAAGYYIYAATNLIINIFYAISLWVYVWVSKPL